MQEQIIRIIVNTTVGELRQGPDGKFYPFTRPVVFQKGGALPPPEGEPPDPVVIVDIQEVELENGDGFFLIYAVGTDHSVFQQNDIGFIVSIPADTVIRKDSGVKASEMLLELNEMRRRANEPEPEEEEPEPEPEVQAPPAAVGVPMAPVQMVPVGLPPEIAAMSPPPPGTSFPAQPAQPVAQVVQAAPPLTPSGGSNGQG